ncbi:Lipopolysaccharide core biosynthesis glycosyltransferase WaaE [Chlamydiales bacterium STE3]|nr:Lipopolysaccharide core biosynthesis glycosyltransferase WaaE [Chlamydiales bacterium STE3]
MITVTVLTKNSQKYLPEVLKSCAAFDEILLFDNGSIDQTIEIARQFPNVKVVEGTFKGFGVTHNEASSLASNNWILSIDSDEILTDELVAEIQKLSLDTSTVYAISRHNKFNDKFIKWCGWYPDYQIRLYNREKTAFNEAQVHESIMVKDLKLVKLCHPLVHYSYENVADFLTKMQSYSHLFALQNCGKKSSSPFKALLHAYFAFFKSYFLKKGFLGGYEGFLISMYNSHTAFYKYIKLYEMNQKSKCSIVERMRR